MSKKKQSPLQAAMNGEADQLTEKETKGALSQAIDKLTNVTRRAETSKEAIMETGSSALHAAETLGTTFLASMGEGFLGRKKLKAGGIDLRAILGLALEGYGLYETLSGETSGQHALAIGNGLTASWMASAGVEAGTALRERRAQQLPAGQPQQPTTFQGEPMVHVPALPTPTMQLIPEPGARLSGKVREIMLTPDPDEVAGPGRRVARRMSRREDDAEVAGPVARRIARRQGARNMFPRADDVEELSNEE